MKISAALAQATKALNGVGNEKSDSLILLAYAISFSKEQIVFNPDFEINLAQQKKFFDLVARRVKHEPVSQIIGKREFFGVDFLVSKDVLDPRPDSETLIELVLKIFPDKNQKLKILELGVGSGCLIISLLKAFLQADATGVDISKKALEISRKNAVKHQVKNRLQLFESDLFSIFSPSPLAGEGWGEGSKNSFDLIISNPPYIISDEIKNLQPEIRIYEPRIALDGGVDGLDFYRRIAAETRNFLATNGKIILEIGFAQEEQVKKIFAERNFSFIELKLDLSGVSRALCFC